MQIATITETMTRVWNEYRRKSRSTEEDARKNKPNVTIKNGVRNRRIYVARYGALSIRPRLSTFVSVKNIKTAIKNGQSQDAVPAARTAPKYRSTLIRLTRRLSSRGKRAKRAGPKICLKPYVRHGHVAVNRLLPPSAMLLSNPVLPKS